MYKIKEDIMNFYEESFKEAQSFLDDFELDESNFVADASFEVKKNTNNVINTKIILIIFLILSIRPLFFFIFFSFQN